MAYQVRRSSRARRRPPAPARQSTLHTKPCTLGRQLPLFCDHSHRCRSPTRVLLLPRAEGWSPPEKWETDNAQTFDD